MSYNQSFYGTFICNSSSSESEIEDNMESSDSVSMQEILSSEENTESSVAVPMQEINSNTDPDIDLYSNANENSIFPSQIRNSMDHFLTAALLYAFVSKGMSEDGLNCIMTILFSVFAEVNIPKTVLQLIKKFKKEIFDFSVDICIKYFCKTCGFISFERKKNCVQCKGELSSMANIDIDKQISLLLSNHNESIKMYQRYCCTHENGDILQNLMQDTTLNDITHLHLLINTDGGNITSTTGRSYWPLSALVLDLPPILRYRQENMLLLALWYGSSKPTWDIFIKDFLSSIKLGEIQHVFVGNSRINVKITINRGVFDLPALASILNVKQFNGKFGCIFCDHPGRSYNGSWIYPFSDDIHDMTDQDFDKYSKIADATKETVFGIKGFSVLKDCMKIPSEISLDPLHLYYENVTKMLINFMTCSKNRHKENYLGNKIHYINNIISKISVPHNMNNFKSLERIGFWTGRDYQNFLFYIMLPVVGFSLPYAYLVHLASFVISVRLSVSQFARQHNENINCLFQYFVKNVDELYSPKQMTLNVHLLSHVSNKIKVSGSMNYSSVAPFEAQFKLIKKVVKGTTGHFNQAISKFLLMKTSYAFLLSNSNLKNPAYTHIRNVLDIDVCSNVTDVETIDKERFRIRHFIFHTKNYGKDKISSSYYCKINNNFGKILKYTFVDDKIHLELQMFDVLNVQIFKENDNTNRLLDKYFSLFYAFVKLSEKVISVEINDVNDVYQCFLIENINYNGTLFSLMCVLPDAFIFS